MDQTTAELKESLKAPFDEHIRHHYRIASAPHWYDCANQLMRDIDTYSMIGVCVRTGDNLIGNHKQKNVKNMSTSVPLPSRNPDPVYPK